ncbi:EAL and HDOD domain-containing protein [Chrysiogenes arsenatis]|uniref:EAL and HDOD domain-containing protein n=1 Tax=Chrysiogenes arsenatis TaxID=309797 RepID=UPI0003F9CDE7|nr:HDOD domain-containing protein [Chrysiogenes arsenatis]
MNIFIARQPIFDLKMDVYAYELLFRIDGADAYDYSDGDKATANVLADTLSSIDLSTLTGQQRYFINFTSNLIISDVASLFPKELLHVEVLEDVDPTPDVIDSCKKLKENGYMIVLDDFEYDPSLEPLVELADIIKVDFLLSPPEEWAALAQRVKGKNIKLLAEKLENVEMFETAKSLGYEYFQGYFFSRPTLTQVKDIAPNKMSSLSLMREINRTDVDLKALEQIIRRDVSLSMKLLKLINSAVFGLRTEVSSVGHALTLLGISNVKKWASVVALSQMGEGLPTELIEMTLIRGNFCDLLSKSGNLKIPTDSAYFVGTFSLIDTFIGRPLDEILADIPLTDEIKHGLLKREGKLGHLLNLIENYEKGLWKECEAICSELGVIAEAVSPIYLQSVKKTQDIMEQLAR